MLLRPVKNNNSNQKMLKAYLNNESENITLHIQLYRKVAYYLISYTIN